MDLLEGERLIWSGYRAWRSQIGFLLGWGLVALLPAAAAIAIQGSGVDPRWVGLTLVLLAVLIAVAVVRRFWVHYAVTDGRVHLRRGIVARSVQTTNLSRVQNLNLRQTLLDRVLGIGTLDFDTAGTAESDSDFAFDGIADPATLQRKVLTAMGSNGGSGL